MFYKLKKCNQRQNTRNNFKLGSVNQIVCLVNVLNIINKFKKSATLYRSC